MPRIFLLPFLLSLMVITSCQSDPAPDPSTAPASAPAKITYAATKVLADTVRAETARAWAGYRQYAWGHDVLHPLSKSYHDWYEEPLSISIIDGYSTLKVMGLEDDAGQIEKFVTDTLSFDRDIFVKTFEVNIRILGGLLAMYEQSRNPEILAKAKEFADRIMPAFDTPHGLPRYYVNLKTSETRGDQINVAEAGTFLIEMGVLSYYTEDPKYYAAAKRANQHLYDNRSPLGLVGQNLDVQTGRYTDSVAHIGACIDSYYEYLHKAWLLFGDTEAKAMWDEHLLAIQQHIASSSDTSLWYGNINRYTGEKTSGRITLWDAYFPGLLAYSGEMDAAKKAQRSWDGLWNTYGLEPMVWNFTSGEIEDPKYYLNPEIIESAYYLYRFTGETEWLDMVKQYWADYQKHCRNDVAYHHIMDVRTMEPGDEMSTFLFAESLKYFYLAFAPESDWHLKDVVFSTEAHPFRKENFDHGVAKERLGY